MTAERYKHIQMLFEKAVDLSSDRREEYLKQECGNDRELYDEVMSLLSADEKSHSIFSGSAADYIPADKIVLEGRIGSDDIDQAISYSRLVHPIAPFSLITNGKEIRIFDT